MNVLSLFDGMSCGQIALNKCGIKYENYYASEIDKYAIQISQKNYPDTIRLGDVTKIKGSDLPKIDLLIGGSPCQSFSRSGDGSGFDGKSRLFWEYVRILKEVNPKYFLLENVVMKKEWENIITEALGVEPILIDSKFFSAQKRQRLYWTNIKFDNNIIDRNIDILDILKPNGDEKIISNASCTTNNAAPMIKIIDELCGIEQAYITTVHSFTTDQSLHDQPHKDLRRARGASQSIVPTTTGAAKALTKIFPKFEGKIGGCGIRVPVPDGSLTDITFNVKRQVSIDEINAAFKTASQTNFKGILDYTEDPIVSVDIIGNTNSCIFDAQLTSVIDKMVKVVGWYDNEIGYSSRIIDLILLINSKKVA
jgi:DNA-cytosine methyltransferase